MAIDAISTPVTPQNANPDRMERPHPDRACGQVQEILDPATHLARCLIGKRDRENFAGLGPALLDQPGDPVREHARLAAAGAGEDQQWPIVGGHGCPLRRIQSGEEIDRPLRGRRGRHTQYPASLPARRRGQFAVEVVTSAGGRDRASDRRPCRPRRRLRRCVFAGRL